MIDRLISKLNGTPYAPKWTPKWKFIEGPYRTNRHERRQHGPRKGARFGHKAKRT